MIKSWYEKTLLGDSCDHKNHCDRCEPSGVCDICDTVDGRWISAVSDYASTCDYCGELSSHSLMTMHEPTQLGLCDLCVSKGIAISVFDELPLVQLPISV